MEQAAVPTKAQGSSQPLSKSSPKRVLRLTHVLVILLLLWAAVDLIGRLGPVEWLHILPEHVATRCPGHYYPFIPNLRLREDPWVGETATTGNLPPQETRSPVTFSTDAKGFRLTPGVPPDGDVDLVLFSGSSFAYGGGLSDDQTFPAVFTQKTGRRMYNGGHFWWDPQDLPSLDWLLDNLKGPRSAVVMLAWEDADFVPAHLSGAQWPGARLARPLVGEKRNARLAGWYEYGRRYLNAIWNISPLEVLSIRSFKKVSNDRILPNPYKAAVVPEKLPNGEDLLYLREEVNRVEHPPSDAVVKQHGDYFEMVAKHLAARNVDMYVILLPNRYTVYQPFTNPARTSRERYLDRMQRELEGRGIKVYNSLPLLQSHAAEDVASGKLSFYREDHHWSPLGVEHIADGFARYLSAEGSR